MTFVRGHGQGNGAGKTMYGVCYATTQRAYGIEAPKTNWRGELVAFADDIGFGGTTYGYVLAGRGFPPPASVHFQGVGSTCVIQVKPWNKTHSREGPNPSPGSYQMIGRRANGVGYERKPAKTAVVTSVTTAGLATVYPEKLRG